MRQRLRHLFEALLRPSWKLGGFLTLDLFGGVLTLRDEIAPDLFDWGGLKVVHFTWWGWAIFTLAGLLLILFEGSFQVRRRLEAERAALQSKLDIIGAARALKYVHLQVQGSGPIAPLYVYSVGVEFTNIAEEMIAYDFISMSISVNGRPVQLEASPDTTGLINKGENLTYYAKLSEPANVNFPFTLLVGFVAEYDNIKPVNKRRFGRTIEYNVNAIDGSSASVTTSIKTWVEN